MPTTYRYHTIKNPKEKIEKTLKSLQLKIVEKKFTVERSIKNEKRFFMPTCFDSLGNKVFLKARLQNTPEVLDTLKKEIIFFKKVGPIISSLSPHFLISKFLKAGGDGKEYYWMVREYAEGSFSGYMDVDLGITKKFLKKVSPQDLALRLFSLQKASPKIIKIIKPDRHSFNWYWTDYSYYLNTQSLITLVPTELKLIGTILQKNKNLIERQTMVISHGDLYPNNLLLLNNGEALLIDWELININIEAFDPGFIWLLSFRDKDWQKKFLKTFLKKVKNPSLFKKLFYLAILSLSLRFFRADHIALSTFGRGYKQKMKALGYSEKQIRGTPKKAREARTYHWKVLKNTLKNPNHLFK